MSQEDHEGPSESGEAEEQQYERAMERGMEQIHSRSHRGNERVFRPNPPSP